MRHARFDPTETYDVIVVGARVAGAATAMLLARRGLRVLMVDRRRPDTDTLSTHAQMRGAVLQLERWGLLRKVVASGAPAVRRTTFHYGDTIEAIDLKASGGVDALYAPRRYVLDSILVEAAAEAGAEIRFGITVRDLITDAGGRVVGIDARTSAGGPFRARAPLTVGADGVRSIVARRVGAPIEWRGRGASAFLYSYWSDLRADGYEWFYRPGVSAGLIPTNNAETCVWVGAPRERFESELRRDFETSFHRVFRQAAPGAAARLERQARRESRFYAFPGLPGFRRRPFGNGWALVGDASHFKDPLSAHGITDALRDAELLAEAIGAIGRGVDRHEALTGYARVRDRLSIELHEATDALASYEWDLERARELLLAMSRAMKHEVEALLELDTGSRSAA